MLTYQFPKHSNRGYHETSHKVCTAGAHCQPRGQEPKDAQCPFLTRAELSLPMLKEKKTDDSVPEFQ